MNKQDGQALVGGLILIVVVLFFSAYFLYVSESFLRLFSNTEQANSDIVKETSNYANILNEISINNQNIIAAISVSENALLKAFEYSLYIGFHQPYWVTYSLLKNQALSTNMLSTDSEKNISNIFESYSLTSARGFFIAKSLAEKNNQLLKKLPLKLRPYFIQSTNAQVNCFALEAEKKYYTSPGILNLPILTRKMYHFYLQREVKNQCALEHKVGVVNKFMELSVPNFFSTEKDRVIDYSQIENSYNYGILYVNLKQKNNFINSLDFYSSSKASSYEKKFSVVENLFSKLNFFKGLNLGNKEKLLKSSLTNQFIITHKLIYCHISLLNCSISEEQFLRAFFYPNWTVTGVYK